MKLRLLLHPWLVPSSGIAGLADDLISQGCPVCCIVLFHSAPPLSYLSYKHLSTLSLAALFFFSLVYPHLYSILLTMCSSLILITWPLESFFCNLLGRLCQSCCPSNYVFISDLIPPCHSTHQYQHPNLK